MNKKLFCKLIILAVVLIFSYSIYQNGFAQTIESVQEKIKENKLDEAEKEANQLLKNDENNIEVLELLNQIKQLKKKKESKLLTKKAIIAIDNEDFEVAFDLLEKALVLDPDNKEARELFLSLNEVVKVEKKSEKEEQKIESQKIAKKTENNQENIVTSESGQIIAKGKSTGEVEKKGKLKPEFTNWLEAEVSPLYAFTNSNRLSYFDSRQSLIGSRIQISYYPSFIKRKAGVSLEYLGLLFKTSGSDYIKFNVHRVNIYLSYRTYLLEDDRNNKLLIEPKLGYSFFSLNNLTEYGAYEFKKLYGPVAGVNLTDSVFYRFIKKDFLKRLGLNTQFNLLYIPQKGAPISPEFYIGPYYKMGSFNINAGFRMYIIFKGNVKETYSDIEAGVSYFM